MVALRLASIFLIQTTILVYVLLICTTVYQQHQLHPTYNYMASCKASPTYSRQAAATISSSSSLKEHGELSWWPIRGLLASGEERCAKDSSGSGSGSLSIICMSIKESSSHDDFASTTVPRVGIPSQGLDLLPMLPKTVHVPPAGPNPMGNAQPMSQPEGSGGGRGGQYAQAAEQGQEMKSKQEVKD